MNSLHPLLSNLLSNLWANKKIPKSQRLRDLTFFGGRYKTRTCDLPHVKRMRYQLRQSSICRQEVFYTKSTVFVNTCFYIVAFCLLIQKRDDKMLNNSNDAADQYYRDCAGFTDTHNSKSSYSQNCGENIC